MGSASTATPDHAAASLSADAVFRLVYRSRSRIEPARSGLALSDILGVARNKNTAFEQIGGVHRTFPRWAMAYVGERDQPDVPQLATPTGTATAACWRLSDEQE